ncbi:MAG: hypothetical protein D3909_07760 [Candidatus Electrothrix sp. ATG1]|nr:hypothetical protein [Candidatus Electrothrix sp. ATG1]
MKTTGELYEHRGLIALTGAFLVVVALSGCGNERISDPQVRHGSPPVSHTEIVLQKDEQLPAKEHPVTLASPQEVKAVTVQPVHPAPVKSKKITLSTELPISLETPAVLPSQPPLVSSPAQCDMTNIADPLRNVVTALEKKNLLYATQPLTDCSGIFHRVVQGLQHRCPGKEFPSVQKHRDSRALAGWYHERGQLQLIENAVESTDLLRPGAVLFFGKNGSVYKDFSVDDLLVPRKGIAHLGVVVNVHKDASGKVVHYELFHGHGRKGKTPASVTNWHKRTPTRAGYPAFGNGRQQWVAIARL